MNATDTVDIAVSDAAAKRISQILAKEDGEKALRVSVEGGGCSGFQYEINLDDAPGARTSDTYAKLIGQGVSDRLARQWIAQHGEDYVATKLKLVAEQDGVDDPARYLNAAIRHDYQPAAPVEVSPEARAAAQARAASKAQEDAAAQAEANERDAERRGRAQRMARVRDVVAARNPTQRDADRRLFLSQLDNDLDREDFARLGWASALNARAIFAFWEEMTPGVFDDLVS